MLPFVFINCAEIFDSGSVGPCVHSYEDPVIHIQSIKNAKSGLEITEFVIKEITIDSIGTNLRILTLSPSYSTVYLDSSLFCTIPCGFGVQEGVYKFKISAPNYIDTIVTINAKYSMFKGGCPSSNSGGTKVGYLLQPI